MKEVKLNKKTTNKFIVEEKHLAVNIKSGALRVLATPVLAAWMEETACDAVNEFMEDGENTVGTRLDLAHNAPTPLGATVTVTAEIVAVNGREITLHITANDNLGEIAICTHKRFQIFSEKFQKKADSRIK